MKRAILSAFVALAFVLTAPGAVVVAKTPEALQSVQPLKMYWQGELRNVCTVTSIDSVRRYWLTAEHCVKSDGEARYILGEEITVVMRDVKNDLAVVSTPTVTLKALRLAKKGPNYLEDVKVVGHPFGFEQALIVLGRVAAPSVQIDPDEPNFMLIDITGAPGNSGSAVLNKKGEIVSVVQIGWGRAFEPMMGGVLYETLAKYVEYFGKK